MSIRKIQTVEALQARVRGLQSEGKSVVFTNGCFDILHGGHVELFRRARSFGDRLVVAVNADASVRLLKGENRPILPEAERAEVLAALETVDFVCVFDGETPLETILALRPDVLVKGADWNERGIVGRPEVEGWGGRVEAIPIVEGHSTTAIIDRVASRPAE